MVSLNKKEMKIFDTLRTLAQSEESVANASIAAAIVFKNEVIAFGQNSFKSHPFQKRFAKNEEAIYLHAETNAIKNALKKISVGELSKCKLFISRVKKDGSLGLAKPCMGCQHCINTFNINEVYYTDDRGEVRNG